jgi:hypothetical protein
VSVNDRDIRRAESLGRIAAADGLPVNVCPYEANGDPDHRVLAVRFVRAYMKAGGKVAVDYEDGAGPSETTPSFHPIEHQGRTLNVAVVRRPPAGDDA